MRDGVVRRWARPRSLPHRQHRWRNIGAAFPLASHDGSDKQDSASQSLAAAIACRCFLGVQEGACGCIRRARALARLCHAWSAPSCAPCARGSPLQRHRRWLSGGERDLAHNSLSDLVSPVGLHPTPCLGLRAPDPRQRLRLWTPPGVSDPRTPRHWTLRYSAKLAITAAPITRQSSSMLKRGECSGSRVASAGEPLPSRKNAPGRCCK